MSLRGVGWDSRDLLLENHCSKYTKYVNYQVKKEAEFLWITTEI